LKQPISWNLQDLGFLVLVPSL